MAGAKIDAEVVGVKRVTVRDSGFRYESQPHGGRGRRVPD